MSKNWSGPIGPVTLVSAQRATEVFETLADAAWAIRRRGLTVRLTLPEMSPWGVIGEPVILRDDCGLVIPPWRILEEIRHLPPAPLPAWWRSRFGSYDPERDFRSGPVPGIRSRYHRGTFYRHMKTRAELREIQGLEADLADAEDFPVRVKIRRKRKDIPTLWDDIPRSRKGNSWKGFRQTRYKLVD
ncbi:hypothetical protein LAZ40_05690 [Cereibacter sphaeroides]|uniref:hypothetical protein n=1 Tax=Cereibacter sphaeroides TaxID=1063 RepID=UPI001F46D7AA|nr:hypothetical protein [Cereibacter sphaeroides]MCE6958542.1 hypothetical protein [Cereibacter sphaeroides]MCE6972795.1 hypothetical protein [Cereibacter sphaeroides]